MHSFRTKTAIFAIVMSTISSVLAAPTPAIPENPNTALNKRVNANQQSCTCTQHFIDSGSYSIDIGIPIDNQAGCDDVYNALPDGVGLNNWQCVSDGAAGFTQLWFNMQLGHAAQINAALNKMYPTIQGGFNCPDN